MTWFDCKDLCKKSLRSDFVIFLSDCFYDFFSFAVSLVSSCIIITKYKVKAKAYPFWIRENLFFIGRGGGEGGGRRCSGGKRTCSFVANF